MLFSRFVVYYGVCVFNWGERVLIYLRYHFVSLTHIGFITMFWAVSQLSWFSLKVSRIIVLFLVLPSIMFEAIWWIYIKILKCIIFILQGHIMFWWWILILFYWFMIGRLLSVMFALSLYLSNYFALPLTLNLHQQPIIWCCPIYVDLCYIIIAITSL